MESEAGHIRRFCLASLAALTIAASLGGCGTPRAEPSASTASFASDIPPTPSANDYVSAVLNTRTRGSAKLATTINISTPAGERVVVGRGSTFLDPGYGVMTWSGDGSYVEMVNDQGIFDQSDPPDGRWTHAVDTKQTSNNGTGGTTTTSGSADPLRGLGVAQDVAEAGTETLGKVVTTKYTGRLPVTPAELRAMGLTEDEIAAIGDSWQGADEQVTVWVDPDGFIARIDRSIDLPDADGGPVSVGSTTTIKDFGSTLDVTTPSSDLIDSATASPR